MVSVDRRTRQRPSATPAPDAAEVDGLVLPPFPERSKEEEIALFDREARRLVGRSGEELPPRCDRGDDAGIEEGEFGRTVVE
jgi:hypothetical protein